LEIKHNTTLSKSTNKNNKDMFLEKLEIQGFKSFASKNILVFPGMLDQTRRGITAIVGPNGSGKSNVADAVRWVLGEQSMKALRGKKGEDVIFSGSDKRGKMGMAEVSLFLNNEDGQAPIDFSQVVLTRRLYRDGESEYILNNNKVRLSDIQILLAKSKFGQKTYSVIGQGMVEDFLNTSLSERKEFFDEATGVKQFQIKRDESLNKLKLSYENLSQAQMLLEEIEPRLKSLTRQVGRLHRRGELEIELRDWQQKYYCQVWHELDDKYKEINNQFLEIEKNKQKKEKELEIITKELGKMQEQNGLGGDFDACQTDLNEWQLKRDILVKRIAVLEAQKEVKLESRGQFDVSWLMSKRVQLEQEVGNIKNEISVVKKQIETETQKLKILEAERQQVKQNIIDKENLIARDEELSTDNQEAKEINERIKNLLEKLESIEDEFDQNKIAEILNHIREELRMILKNLEKEKVSDEQKNIQKELLSLVRASEDITFKIHEENLIINTHEGRVGLLGEQAQKVNDDLQNIFNKLQQYQAQEKNKPAETNDENGENQEKLNEELKIIQKKIDEIKEKISCISQEEEVKRNRLFGLQRKTHELQNEINGLSTNLNELKINAARYETRLEDLETEVREFFSDFREIRDQRLAELINLDEAKEKISSLKKQLDLIGGIDPEVEKEYIGTKTRFDFLKEQVDDLLGAIRSLEEVVKELDLTIKEKFDKEFKVITAKFEEYFKILFNGGSAKIVKVMEDQIEKEEKAEKAAAEANGQVQLEINPNLDNLKRIKYLQKHSSTGLAGIEIQATPPGKKIQAISMLSGGERALVAIALICAIISSNPSPFVVLDEVDASLDEANSERLAKILDDLSHRTQFIVVTHNRASMRRANILYGVAMQEDGVSKLLSIKLDEATEQLAK